MENNRESSNRTLIVDGMALLFRAYYAQSYGGYIRKTSDGTPTNAIFGFIHYLFDAIKEFQPTHLLCCWDLGSATFRNEMYSSYKANRAEAPEELIPQFGLVKDVVDSLGIPNFGVPGFEADDCIGTIANQISTETDVLILTGDHDMLQLVTEKISVIIMKKGKSNYQVYTPVSLWDEKELYPSQIVDLKAFMGDTADNYPGVRGIGEKTAHKLIKEYGSVLGVLENIEKLPASTKLKIESNKDMLFLSKDLATIKVDVPVECALENCCWKINRSSALQKFEELEFSSLIKLIG
ncbi:5'-3' exonuclease [Paenibacillus radicis (ex Xue et al. 2023)]|uniref:5'-3' exonuclease n=1 Tax=Paenibacillus radicis (ex Xue et al. 2023) TaxID=2972489 RepID=A0ABT1YJU8_9BACL|nr:5'-3' exonuclease H3TH domain-containing protein [Paenibacillus radicis (ex Xue et al. 2023)]MCR8633436.1 5'-3' exonuclease [Paenibacillus radicis (ex Xue et al. 2023)]